MKNCILCGEKATAIIGDANFCSDCKIDPKHLCYACDNFDCKHTYYNERDVQIHDFETHISCGCANATIRLGVPNRQTLLYALKNQIFFKESFLKEEAKEEKIRKEKEAIAEKKWEDTKAEKIRIAKIATLITEDDINSDLIYLFEHYCNRTARYFSECKSAIYFKNKDKYVYLPLTKLVLRYCENKDCDFFSTCDKTGNDYDCEESPGFFCTFSIDKNIEKIANERGIKLPEIADCWFCE